MVALSIISLSKSKFYFYYSFPLLSRRESFQRGTFEVFLVYQSETQEQDPEEICVNLELINLGLAALEHPSIAPSGEFSNSRNFGLDLVDLLKFHTDMLLLIYTPSQKKQQKKKGFNKWADTSRSHFINILMVLFNHSN